MVVRPILAFVAALTLAALAAPAAAAPAHKPACEEAAGKPKADCAEPAQPRRTLAARHRVREAGSLGRTFKSSVGRAVRRPGAGRKPPAHYTP